MVCTIRFKKFTAKLNAIIVDALCSDCLIGIDFLSECPSTKHHVKALKELVVKSKSENLCESSTASESVSNLVAITQVKIDVPPSDDVDDQVNNCCDSALSSTKAPQVEPVSENFSITLLSQLHEEALKPIAYWSKHLSKAQRNYSASEREMLAVVLAIEHFRQYLYGRQFRVISDHQPLKSLMTASDPHPQLARW